MIRLRTVVATLFSGVLMLLFSHLAQARSIDAIKASGVFSICANQDALPFSQRGDPEGIQIELAREIASMLSVRLDIQWTWARHQAKYAECDAIMGVARDPSPAGYLRFTQTILDVEVIFAHSLDLSIKSKNDLIGKTVAVTSGSLAHWKLLDTAAELRVSFRSDTTMLDAIVAEEIDAAVVTNITLGWHQAASNASRLGFSRADFLEMPTGYPMSIGLRQSDSLTQADFEEIMLELRNSGRLDAILARYGQQLSDAFDDYYARIEESLRPPPAVTVRKDIVEALMQRVEQ